MANIYISSTYLDLKEHREQVEQAILRMGHTYNAMELYVAEDRRPVAKCLDDVSQCDILLGIYAWRYGWIPHDDNPENYSITEMEYRQAEKLNKHCMIFLLDDTAPWPRKDIDRDPTRIEGLRQTASARHTADYFTTPDELVSHVMQAINKWDKEHPLSPAPPPTLGFKTRLLDSIPDVPQFVGREKELAEYRQRLANENLVIIEGMAGIGKTTLGAKLAREQLAIGRKIFWVTFDTAIKNSIEEFIWDLAKFLDDNGSATLGQFLEREARASRSPDFSTLFGLILNELKSVATTLCFDDLQAVIDDKTMQRFFNEIHKRYQNRNSELPFQFIIMTREMPFYMRGLFGPPLNGFTETDAIAFLSAHNIALTQQHFQRLFQQVEGNPQFLRLSLTGLQAHLNDPDALTRFIEGLEGHPSVRDYLMAKVYGTLSDEFKQVLDALSIFPNLVPRSVVETVLANEGIFKVNQVLDEMACCHDIIEAQESNSVGLHALVRDYCYRNLDPSQRERFHSNAAVYFFSQRDWVMAAHHHFQAGNRADAAQVLTVHATELMNSGRVDVLLEQLKRFSHQHLALDLWGEICQLKGDALRRHGIYDEAIVSYREALQSLTDRHIQGQLYLGIGECFDGKGQFDQAIQCYEKQMSIAQSLQDPTDTGIAHLRLGFDFYRMSNYAKSSEEYHQAIQCGKTANDPLLVARGYAHLGLLNKRQANFEDAIKLINQSINAFKQAGRTDLTDTPLTNLAHIYAIRGDYSESARYLTQVYEIYKAMGDQQGMCIILNNLGELYREQEEHLQAINYFEQALKIAEATGNEFVLSGLEAGIAESCLALGNPTKALEYSAHAYQIASTIQAKEMTGIIHRIQGEIQSALGHRTEAQREFDQALAILEPLDTKPNLAPLYRSYGIFLLGDPTTVANGQGYLLRAKNSFQAMGADKEVAKIDLILKTRA